MKKSILALMMLLGCVKSFSGDATIPTERVALPAVQGNHLVCLWDEEAGVWLGEFEAYDHAGIYEFEVPEWGRWYWIGLWDEAKEDYVFGRWVGHFPTD